MTVKISKSQMTELEKIAKDEKTDVNSLVGIAIDDLLYKKETNKMKIVFGKLLGFEINYRCCKNMPHYAISFDGKKDSWLVCETHYEEKDSLFRSNIQRIESITDIMKKEIIEEQ